MAAVTVSLGEWENSAVRAFFTYDDANNRGQTLTVQNLLAVAVTALAYRPADGRQYSRSFAPGETSLSIPGTGVARWDVTFDDQGRPLVPFEMRVVR